MSQNQNKSKSPPKKTKKKESLFQPVFVPPGQLAKSQVKWKFVDSIIKGHDQHIYYKKDHIKAPLNWSATAIDIAASKYFRRTVKKENSIEALVERLGQGFATAAKLSSLFKSRQEVNSFVEELKYLMYSQKAAFNSPVWFNLGLKEAYGLTSKSEHFAYDFRSKKIFEISDAYSRPQISACFIQSLEDSIDGIFQLITNEAKLFKYGSGTGTNFSKLRSKFELLSSGGTSSGLISFLEVLDRSAGAIKSGGTTRRAAKMVCMDLDHPEIEDFIAWKMNEEKKAKVLIDAGYSADLDGEAYRSVAGQNANNSVRVTDGFMKSLESGKEWALKFRDGKIYKRIPAKSVWEKICISAWSCADPGLQFDDTINSMHTCSVEAKIKASNPCSEYMFLDDSACNLASLNLVQFLNDKMEFNVAQFIHSVQTLFIAQECLVSYASYPTKKIASNSVNYRPLGLGFANLGSMLMQMGLPYDSEGGRAWAGFLSSLMTGTAYKTSALLAGASGAFLGFKKNKTAMFKVLFRHQKANSKIQWNFLPQEFSELTQNTWKEVIGLGAKYGFRNAQATVIAPTGTIGLVMDCDTTGIEPDFSLIKYKKLSGGGQIKIVNQSVAKGLRHLGYSPSDITDINAYLLQHETLMGSKLLEKHISIFSCATGDHFLSPESHLLMMAAVQPFISGAISKTVNLPHKSSINDVSEIYKKAWKLGLKSVAIYRDGSKFAQPLSGKKSKTKNKFIYPLCTDCGEETILESGCYRCRNCGTTTACVS